LVVISIIALLMGLLLPGLNSARTQAKNVKDMANLKQWGMMFISYTQDNNGKMMGGWNSGTMWMTDLLRYYKGSNAICLCPMASTNFRSKYPATFLFPGTSTADQTFLAWGKFGENGYTSPPWGKPGLYGSYGINGWAHNPPDIGVSGTYNIPTTPVDYRPNYWRTVDVKQTSKIPLFGDCMYDGSEPQSDDAPPATKGVEQRNSEMSIWCIDRHKGGINMTFMDGSVRKVGLKELWKLKWHRNYNTNMNRPPNFWPAWMKGYQDFTTSD
jgi:prepilin-type processing-associated H-X9-DG protein